MDTYSKSAQLPGPTLLEDRHNLRHLASNSQHPRKSLQPRHRLHRHQIRSPHHCARRHKPRNPHCSPTLTIRIPQHEYRYKHILHQNQRCLAIRAERKSMADIVHQRNEVCAALEEVGEKADAFGGPGADELDELGDLDDGGRADDGDAETLRYGKLDAVWFFEGINV
jgi:hypothetical protein